MADDSTMSIEWDEGDLEPHEAFSRLADPNRFDIVRTLAEADRWTLPFSDLYDRSAFEDSGQFNYHLDKLVGPFVRKTDGGYQLRHATRVLYRLAVGGLLSDRGRAAVTTVETPCTRCGADHLTTVYEGDRFWIRCDDCERRVTVGPFPPQALVNHDTERVPAAFDRYMLGLIVRAAENVCPYCASPLAASIQATDDDWPLVDWEIARTCDYCQGWVHTRVHDLVRLHPSVIAFYEARGVDILGSSFWDAEATMVEGTTVDPDADGWAATVTIEQDGDEIEVGLADDLRASTIEVISGPRT